MVNEIYQIDNPVIVQWFAFDNQYISLSLILYTNSKYTPPPPPPEANILPKYKKIFFS